MKMIYIKIKEKKYPRYECHYLQNINRKKTSHWKIISQRKQNMTPQQIYEGAQVWLINTALSMTISYIIEYI